MLRFYFYIVLFFTQGILFAQHSVKFSIEDLPPVGVKSDSIYLAGSFNGWNPKDEKYRFKSDQKGHYLMELTLGAGSYEYKITRGNWSKVECDIKGNNIANRKFKLQGDTTIGIKIENWIDNFIPVANKSTASVNVKIIDTAFFITQLNRHRRIWIYLPQDYVQSNKRYPVLYMHDGQNIFDNATSFSGEWGIDECLDTMKKKCIVVGIDNGGDKRLNEYCPYDFSLSGIAANSISGKGEGKEYVDFLVKNLKPFIDNNYRTMKEKKNTWIAGSSMGGLISMYALLKYPKVFGVAGVFSPAFWVGPQIFDDINKKGFKVKGKIFFYAGELEGESMVPDMLKAYQEMNENSKAKMKIVVNKEGKHNEQAWRIEFPVFYKWIRD